ncbi:hypothetical protein CBS9595_000420 [Malassezia furfur]|nr:hypothetical protein CBS9595_000420 [Malassezia furfur]
MDAALAQFVNVTGASSDTARILESTNGDVSAALALFYDQHEQDAAASQAASSTPHAEAAAPAAPAAPTGPRTLSGAVAHDPAPWPSAAPRAKSSQSRPRTGGIMSFNDLRGHESPDDERDDDRDPVNLFTGGERSGLSVENPDARRGQDDENSIVRDILSKAASAAQGSSRARELDLQGSSSSPRVQAFSGAGHSIGGATVEPERPAAGMPGALGAGDEEDEEDEEPAVRHLTFWQDGFSIEDGPLMRYDDPANRETLEAINSGRAPLSLLNVRFGQPVELLVARRTNEKYVPPPPPPMQPFGGSGNRLGAPAPPRPAAAPAATSSAPTSAPRDVPAVDEAAPVTQIQVRLPDGQRLIAKLNHSHTVGDLRRYIQAHRPELAEQAYTLQTSFPPRPLTDETQSVADAQLLHSVVMVKFT